MSRRLKRHLSQFIIPLLLTLGILAGGQAPSVSAASGAAQPSVLGPHTPALPQNAAGPTTLLVHGVTNDYDHLIGGCDGPNTWGPTIGFLSSHDLYSYSVGYYMNDYDCGPDKNNPQDPLNNLYTYEQVHQHCINYHSGPSEDGTWNDDDRHVACELAWYIWDNFTVAGAPVNLVAHSLGGVLIKEALYQIYVANNTVGNGQNPPGYFPNSLFISHIVTIASPLGGAPLGSDVVICSSCEEIVQLEPLGSIYGDLTSQAGENLTNRVQNTWTSLGKATRHATLWATPPFR